MGIIEKLLSADPKVHIFAGLFIVFAGFFIVISAAIEEYHLWSQDIDIKIGIFLILIGFAYFWISFYVWQFKTPQNVNI